MVGKAASNFKIKYIYIATDISQYYTKVHNYMASVEIVWKLAIAT